MTYRVQSQIELIGKVPLHSRTDMPELLRRCTKVQFKMGGGGGDGVSMELYVCLCA